MMYIDYLLRNHLNCGITMSEWYGINQNKYVFNEKKLYTTYNGRNEAVSREIRQ